MEQKSNHLINEKSPYLLQHAYNPVEWYAWNDEAFKKAEKENKPIFLSIGYSTCHWCHVMEHESFEDKEVAALMNDVFVSIKVDREERPDIDHIYMTVCQMITGQGGWPLTIVMTPDKRPFYAATYIPKESRFGRPGLKDLIKNIDDVWKTNRDEVESSADQITGYLKQSALNDAGSDLPIETFHITYKHYLEKYDEKYGGWGTSPKFPSPHNMLFLLRYWKRTGENQALQMTEKTLLEMAKGGIFDHIGYGFHRYSTDQQWLVPHFEKMLYDQAMLIHAYTECYQATGNELLKRTAEQIIEYVKRDMTSPEGGFYSAEDADSEGIEGKFYVWTLDELKEILGKDNSTLFASVFNITEEGNYEEEASRTKTGANIPYLSKSIDELSSELNIPKDKLESPLDEIRQKLFEIREQRIHPSKDDKILTDWNGLMISALAKAGTVFENDSYIDMAKKAYEFIEKELTDESGKLLHRYRDGEAKLNACLDDYAFVIWGLLELYESTFDITYLQKAVACNTILMKHYWDDLNGGFFFTPDFGENLLVRNKEIYDSAIPSGSSVMMNNLIKLSRLTAENKHEESALLLSKSFSNNVTNAPQAFTHFLCGLDFAKGPSNEIVLLYSDDKDELKPFLKELHADYTPNKVIVALKDDDKHELKKIIPFIKDYDILKGKPTAYVCKNFACSLPVTEPKQMIEILQTG